MFKDMFGLGCPLNYHRRALARLMEFGACRSLLLGQLHLGHRPRPTLAIRRPTIPEALTLLDHGAIPSLAGAGRTTPE